MREPSDLAGGSALARKVGLQARTTLAGIEQHLMRPDRLAALKVFLEYASDRQPFQQLGQTREVQRHQGSAVDGTRMLCRLEPHGFALRSMAVRSFLSSSRCPVTALPAIKCA